MDIRRGDIFLEADFKQTSGSVQKGVRPCIVVSNNLCNIHSPVVTVVPITTQNKTNLPTHYILNRTKYLLRKDSIVLAEQIITIDRNALKNKHICRISPEDMWEIDQRLKIQLGLPLTGA